MTATFIPIGEPAHDAERQALRWLVEGLPAGYLVYGNPWLVERSGAVYELDAVVVAPHAVYVVEIKSYRGDIGGNDNDWYLPQPIRSPLKLNRRTAQVLAGLLKLRSVDAARPFVEGFVFLSHATSARVVGPASQERVHTRRTIVTALQDAAALFRREGPKPPVEAHARQVLDELLKGADAGPRPVRLIREWQIETTIDRTDRYGELFATHRITGQHAVLRVHDLPLLCDEATRRRAEDLFRWEAQVLRRIGEHPDVLHADAPFIDEAGMVLPFEHFKGVTLGTWIDKHGTKLTGPAGIKAKFELWRRIVEAIEYAHQQGVIHRLLRPEVVLVEDKPDAMELRVGGFELAKQTYLPGQTVAISRLGDDRKRFSAPEVVRMFSDAEPRSDQFGLGALLGHLLSGRPLFDSTEEMLRRGGAFTRLRDLGSSFKVSLDQAVATMLERSSANRFRSLGDALAAVEQAITGVAPTLPFTPSLDPENLTPGARIGSDYEIREKLGAGGMATVYAARHLVSGAARALKVARPDLAAEEALRAEHLALQALDHPNIVRAIDITGIVPERRTLVLERVKGAALSARLKQGSLSDEERRQYAEHLFAALTYLEQKGIVHKDIKPDNLIVGPDGLTLIDFSLAGRAPDEMQAGTALYRDPALSRWSPAADRYAAALCLFELYVGRHAFDLEAPHPGAEPRLDAQDFDQPALSEFFRKALAPNPSQRHPSAQAMRAALLAALGSRVSISEAPSAMPHAGTAEAPLSAMPITGTALNVLRGAGITTQGALVALDEAKIKNLSGLGNKKREEVLGLRRALIEAGVAPIGPASRERHPVFPTLVGDETDTHRLALTRALTQALVRAGFTTVGRLADATRSDLSSLSGVGAKKVALVVQALQRFLDAAAGVAEAVTLDRAWEHATAPLQGQQKQVLERIFGLHERPVTQVELSRELQTTQPAVSLLRQRGLATLDRRALDEIVDYLEGQLISAGGILRIDEAAQRLLERWPAMDGFGVEGLIRLIAEIDPTRAVCHPVLDDETRDVLARPLFDAATIAAFLRAARASIVWPPQRPEATRAFLQSYLPEYPHDPIGLAVRLSPDLRLTDEGELYESPVDLDRAVRHLLHRSRPPIELRDLCARLGAAFDVALTPPPEPEAVLRVVATMPSFRVDPATQTIDVREARSILAQRVTADPLPPELLVRDPGEEARDRLRAASCRDGFRLVVTPPEAHPEIARSVAGALTAAVFVSFEDTFFTGADLIDTLERAERFAAQRPLLRRRAEQVIDELMKQHGRAGNRVVLGDTALFGVCDALHLVRRIYDLTATGGRGFWAVVIPGVVHRRQPLFNEKPGALVFSIEGQTLPVSRELSGEASP